MSYTGLGAIGDVVNMDDFPSVLNALDLQAWSPGLFGFATWADAVQWVNSGNGTTALANGGRGFVSPSGVPVAELVALVQLLNIFRQPIGGYLPTVTQALQALGVSGAWNAPGPRPASLPVTDADWRAYASSALSLASPLAQLFAAFEPGEVPPRPLTSDEVAQQTATQHAAGQGLFSPGESVQQWNADFATALRLGLTTQGIPTALIVEGPVRLPDGTSYIVYRNIASQASDGLSVAWVGLNTPPTYTSGRTAVVMDPFNGREVVPVGDPGTGDWYVANVSNPLAKVTQPPPQGFTGPWNLISARALASLTNQGGATIVNVQTGQRAAPVQYGGVDLSVAPLPSAATVPSPSAPPALMLAPPVVPIQSDPRVDTYASDPSQPVPSVTDPSGLSESQVPSVPPPAPYSPLPSQGAAAQQAAPALSVGLVAVAALFGGMLLAGKRGR